MFLASSPVAVEVASSLLATCLPRSVAERALRMPIAVTATTTSGQPDTESYQGASRYPGKIPHSAGLPGKPNMKRFRR